MTDMTDNPTVPPQPDMLSARMRAWGKVLAALGQPTDAIFLAEWADEAEALEARAMDPWENCRDVVFQDDDDDDVCFMTTKHSTDQSEWRRLIAAAPEMVDLIWDAIAILTGNKGIDENVWVEMARALHTKIKGDAS